MSDNDLIRRGDALKAVDMWESDWVSTDCAIRALPAVAAPDPALRPTMTDMMVDPDMLGAFMEANPLPPDPAAIREAALLADLAQGPMRGELMEPWIRRMMNRAAALIQKGDTDDHA